MEGRGALHHQMKIHTYLIHTGKRPTFSIFSYQLGRGGSLSVGGGVLRSDALARALIRGIFNYTTKVYSCSIPLWAHNLRHMTITPNAMQQ